MAADEFKKDAEGYWKEVTPDAILDYAEEFADWLPSGDTIASAAWTVPTGITASSPSNTTTKATVWLSGFVLGTTYEMSCQINTVQGRRETRWFRLKCKKG